MVEHILYSFRRCPYAMRARLALSASGIRYEVREVRLSKKPKELIAASPKGTVPVLQRSEGVVIDESLAIMRWALGENDPQGWLERDDPALIAANDTAFKHDLDRYKYPDRHGSDPIAHRNNGLGFLQELEARLVRHEQLCENAPGLADAAIMPFVRQFAAVDPSWFATLPLSKVKAWLAQHLASEAFERIMFRLPPWSPGDVPVIVNGGPS